MYKNRKRDGYLKRYIQNGYTMRKIDTEQKKKEINFQDKSLSIENSWHLVLRLVGDGGTI